MATKILYKVHPADPSEMTHIPSGNGSSSIISAIAIINMIFIVVGIILIFINLFSGGYGWLFCAGIVVILSIVMSHFQKEADTELRKQKAIEEAEIYSKQLNEILEKSEEIVNKILPYFETSALKSIDTAKVDFSDNAISPFWDRIEESSKSLACYKEAVDQLIVNGEIYSKILEGKKHNFPRPFPIGTNISISENTLVEFNSTIRKAQTKFEFTNIWEHRKTQKILIAGFQTLEQAINNMKDEILSAIHNLDHSIKSEFRDLKNIQIEQIRTFQAGHTALNNTLTSMDTKLYYMQYNKKPMTPFVRPLFER